MFDLKDQLLISDMLILFLMIAFQKPSTSNFKITLSPNLSISLVIIISFFIMFLYTNLYCIIIYPY